MASPSRTTRSSPSRGSNRSLTSRTANENAAPLNDAWPTRASAPSSPSPTSTGIGNYLRSLSPSIHRTRLPPGVRGRSGGPPECRSSAGPSMGPAGARHTRLASSPWRCATSLTRSPGPDPPQARSFPAPTEIVWKIIVVDGAPDRIRTCDLWLRRPTLYPAELRARGREGYAAECSASMTPSGEPCMDVRATQRFGAGTARGQGCPRPECRSLAKAGLARIFHRCPAADTNLLAVAGRTPSSRFVVVSATPSASFSPCGPLPQASWRPRDEHR